jgi:hypothetical protein
MFFFLFKEFYKQSYDSRKVFFTKSIALSIMLIGELMLWGNSLHTKLFFISSPNFISISSSPSVLSKALCCLLLAERREIEIKRRRQVGQEK